MNALIGLAECRASDKKRNKLTNRDKNVWKDLGNIADMSVAVLPEIILKAIITQWNKKTG